MPKKKKFKKDESRIEIVDKYNLLPNVQRVIKDGLEIIDNPAGHRWSSKGAVEHSRIIYNNMNEKLFDKIYITQSKLDIGKGVFAKRGIRKNERILEFTGPIISGQQIKSREEKGPEGNPLQIGDNKYIDTEEPGVFVNHSCEPNAGIKNDRTLVALRDIKKGEEIFFDYSTAMDEDSWTMECKCGSKKCRGVVKDFKYLSKDVQKKYLDLDIVQKFIVKKHKGCCGR